MLKLIFKDHINPNIIKEVKCFSWRMLPSGSYQADKGCFDKEIINCRDWYLAKVEEL